jgi:hypothetical protein
MGIEPTAQAWEAWVLPLYDARAYLILVVLPKDRQISRIIDPAVVISQPARRLHSRGLSAWLAGGFDFHQQILAADIRLQVHDWNRRRQRH